MHSAAGTGPLPMPVPIPIPSSQSARKEWRAVSEHSVRNTGKEDLERGKLGKQSEERTIYEVQQGLERLDVDFCTITIDGSVNGDDLLQQRLRDVCRQREELQQMEIEIRAQFIVRSDKLEMQKSFDVQLEEHVNAAAKLKEQILEREKCIHDLEIKMEENDRELRSIKIDKEVAWAKEDLLREQNKELAAFRRQLDTFEAERAQNLKQIHDLEEHVREKESQFLELEEQRRVAQETIIYKDEQLRETQAWVSRVQEMDALQSTTNHSLQAELQERTEQFNQLWLGCQRQFQEMERHHMHVIQHLQLQLFEAREQRGIHIDNSQMAHANSKDSSTCVENKGNNFNLNKGGMLKGNSEILPNGNTESTPRFTSAGNASTKTDHVPGVPFVPSSILGMGAFLPPRQETTLHPLVMHQQGVPHSLPPANIPQPHVEHFQMLPAISSHQHWQSQQAVSESSQIPNQTQYQPSQDEQSHLRSDGHYDYELSADGQFVSSDFHKAHISPRLRSGHVVTTSSDDPQVLESNEKLYMTSEEPQQNLQGPSQFHDTIRLDCPEQKNELQGDDGNTMGMTNQLQEEQSETMEQPMTDTNVLFSATPNHKGSSGDAIESNPSAVSLPEVSVSSRQTSSFVAPEKIQGPTLLDERSLLACIVRAIPAGSSGQIRISTTLPNRLGKMLAPLHWHDYKKQYGKLDDFVAHHPELFVIDGDFIHLREGAQAIISATTAIAKVAAAAAAVSAPYSSLLPSVAVTPVAQANRLKKTSAIDPVLRAGAHNQPSHLSAIQDRHSNGASFKIVQGLSNVKILSKPKVIQETNGFSSETRSSHSSAYTAAGNGVNLERTESVAYQNKGSSNSRHDTNFEGKQQGRATGAGLSSRG